MRGSGDVLVRPLNNPPRVANSYFADNDIVAFGLIQRDRSYEAYQDAGAQYHNRPSVMVERIGDWGPGKVRLVEIPADLEIDDNIVMFWVPDMAPQAGETRRYSYRMHWGALPPDGSGPLAYVHSTRTGVGGPSGVPLENPNLRKFVIDFEGGALGDMDPEGGVGPDVTASAGVVRAARSSPAWKRARRAVAMGGGGWRWTVRFCSTAPRGQLSAKALAAPFAAP